MMTKKYQRSKWIKVAEFQLGQNVSLFVPSKERHSSDMKRLPCTVVHRSAGNQPTYRLLSQYGTLERRYTAAKLMDFPGIVRAGDPDKLISLRSATTEQSFSVVAKHCAEQNNANAELPDYYAHLSATSFQIHPARINM